MHYYFKQNAFENKVIEHQKVEDITLKIARKRGVKNYGNLSRIESVKEIDKLEPPKESKKKKLLAVYY